MEKFGQMNCTTESHISIMLETLSANKKTESCTGIRMDNSCHFTFLLISEISVLK